MSPLIGVLCCNEVADRPIQAVATRFIRPLAEISRATVLLVPAVAGTFDAASLAARLDGLLLTGSRSNIAPRRYGDEGVAMGPEAHAAVDGLVEAFSARPAGAPVLAVQWHPEWDAARRPESRAFFRFVGEAIAA